MNKETIYRINKRFLTPSLLALGVCLSATELVSWYYNVDLVSGVRENRMTLLSSATIIVAGLAIISLGLSRRKNTPS